MNLSDLSIRNRVFAVMVTAAMVVFGYLSYRDLGISQFPELDFPVISVTTVRESASPEIMDSDVTDVIEDAVSGVEGIDYIQSQSSQGISVVTVYFHLSRNPNVAMQDVQNAVSAAMGRLPNDIDPPNVSKVNYNKFPVMWLAVHGNRPLRDINEFVDNQLKRNVQTIPGVGGVMYGGLRPRSMRIWLQRDRLQAYDLDAYEVWEALRKQHVEVPAGWIESDRRELNVRVMGEARTAEEFRNLPIVHRNGQLLRLGDLAVVEDGLADRRSFARFNGMPNVGVGVMRAEGGNVVAICDEVKRRLPDIRRSAPEGLEVSISTDFSIFIKDDIEEVQHEMLQGILLTALVTFLFLGSLGTTLNVCISIPASLIGTFIAIKWLGFTLNFMTLLALSLSVGVVVDDAILVLENIYRRRELGESRWQAALYGAREIRFAAIAATFSIMAIFIPIAFMKGSIGQFFYQFGITVSVAVFLSLITALTITPMLCSVFLEVRQPRRPMPHRMYGVLGIPATILLVLLWWIDRWLLEPLLIRPIDVLLDRLRRLYGVMLRVALRGPILVMVFGGVLAASAGLFIFGINLPLPSWAKNWTESGQLTLKPIGRELVPSEDQNRFVINMICPVGSSIDYVDDAMAQAEQILKDLKDPNNGRELIATMYCSTSIRPGQLMSEGIIFVRLIPASERTWTQTDVMNEVRKRFAAISGVRAIVLDLSTQGFTPRRGFPVNFAVQGPDWRTTTELAERIRERLTNSGVVTDVMSDFRPGQMEAQVRPDRAKMTELAVTSERLAFALGIGTGGLRDGRFTVDDHRYDVRVRYVEPDRQSPEQMAQDYVRSDRGALVAVQDVARVDTVSTLPVIHRYNHMRKVEITANMAPGVSQGEAVSQCQEIAEQVRAEMGLTESYRLVQLGNASAMSETIQSMWACLALGFIIAYMILAMQFNSLVHPWTVLVAVPFGVTGALATLWALDNTLNMMSMIGMILLAGLVKKNSIVLVDYTNQLRSQGMDTREALLQACPVRLRPILMTSTATIVGAIPLALGYGAGGETRAPLARSIIGGSLLATSVTLFVVPVFYLLFDRLSERIRYWLQTAEEA